MSSLPTIEDLKTVIALKELSDEHLQWILAHSEYRVYEDGDIIGKYGEPAEYMWFAWTGKVNFYMYINGHQVYYFTFDNDNITGGAGGIMPYSRMKTYPGYSYASGTVRTIRMHKDHFAALEALNPEFIQKLIGYMTERARAFATKQLQNEKVNALGNLAAGVAHELNNPASAIRGISDDLSRRLSDNYDLTRRLLECQLKPEQVQSIHHLVEKKETEARSGAKRSMLMKMEVEEELDEWLQENDVHERVIAETFSEAGFTKGDLQQLRDDLGKECLKKVIPWLENLVSSHKIITDLSNASQRISNLVASIKSHVHMDRTNELQPTDLHKDLENTITLLGFKLHEKNIDVIRKYDERLPEIPAFVGDLNQVWTNLIDNAIFAMDKNGTLTVETSKDEKNAYVSIMDTGKGIPNDILSRIFDPFFTTKKVGEGTGIGLDIVNRIIKKHNGTINVKSEPGKTVFSICIPLAQKIS